MKNWQTTNIKIKLGLFYDHKHGTQEVSSLLWKMKLLPSFWKMDIMEEKVDIEIWVEFYVS